MKRKYDDMILLNESCKNKIITKNILCKDEFCIIFSYLNYKDIRHFDVIFKDHEILKIIKNRRQKCIENLYNNLPSICQNVTQILKMGCDNFYKTTPCKKIKVIQQIFVIVCFYFEITECKCGDKYIQNSNEENHLNVINNEEEMIINMRNKYFVCMNQLLKGSKSRCKLLFNIMLMRYNLFDFCGFIPSNIEDTWYYEPRCIGVTKDSDTIEKEYDKYLHKDVIKERLELKIKRFN